MIKPTEKVCPVCGSSLPKPEKRWQNHISCVRLNFRKVWIKGCNLDFASGIGGAYITHHNLQFSLIFFCCKISTKLVAFRIDVST
jgi:hypothetical protein